MSKINRNSRRKWHSTHHIESSENTVNIFEGSRKPENPLVEPFQFTFLLFSPHRRNALSMAMMTQLLNDIQRNRLDENLRAIVVSSNGPVFSAGHNLKELTEASGRDFHRKVFEKCTELMLAIHQSPVPVIAQVNGLAAAAGCQLVATCDIVVCSEKSTFSTPGYERATTKWSRQLRHRSFSVRISVCFVQRPVLLWDARSIRRNRSTCC